MTTCEQHCVTHSRKRESDLLYFPVQNEHLQQHRDVLNRQFGLCDPALLQEFLHIRIAAEIRYKIGRGMLRAYQDLLRGRIG